MCSRVTFRNKLFTPKFLSHWFLIGHLQLFAEISLEPEDMVQFAFAYWLYSLESERHKLAEFVFWAFTAFEWCSYHHSLHFDQASRALAPHNVTFQAYQVHHRSFCGVKTQCALLCFRWQSPLCCLGVGFAPCGAQLFSKTGLWNCVAHAQWVRVMRMWRLLLDWAT